MGQRRHFGLSTPGGVFGFDEVDAVADAVGMRPDLLLWYEDFAAGPPVSGVEKVIAQGMTPVITWEPCLWRTDRTHTERSIMHGIAAGEYDDYLADWAHAFAAVGTTVYLRFAHEFNGDWYPWSPVGGTTPGDYVDAWRHLHGVFRRQAAGNLLWMWWPNACSTIDVPLQAWYPGDAYVDAIGIDGYNWGTTRQPQSRWMGPQEIFAGTVAEVRDISAEKPIFISETGCAEAGGDKAGWIAAFVDWATAEERFEGFIWFDHDKETDWRICSSPNSAAAMAAALNGGVVR